MPTATAITTDTCVVYARISKDDKGDKLGVDRQEKLARKLAADRGFEVAEVITDNDMSAYSRKPRPGFEKLIEAMKDGEVRTVVCYHPDRLYRRLTDLERLVAVIEATGVSILTVAAGSVDLSTATGRMTARIIGSVAQAESERTGERLKAKNDQSASQGTAPGGRPPFGYQWQDGKFAVEPTEAATLRRAAELVLEGKGLHVTARMLAEEGRMTRSGKPWHHSHLRQSLLNPAVAGKRVLRREVAGPGDWTPIFEPAEHAQIVAVIEGNTKVVGPQASYLLAGLVRTPEGVKLYGKGDRRRPRRANYECRATGHAAGSAIDVERLDTYVVEHVLNALDASVIPEPAKPEASDEVARLETELAKLRNLYTEQVLSLEDWVAAKMSVDERLKAARGAQQRPQRRVSILSEPKAVRSLWPSLSLSQRHEVVTSLVEAVVVSPAPKGRHTPIEDRVQLRWKA